MKLKADDPTFATTHVVTPFTPDKSVITKNWLEWLYAFACRQAGEMTNSYGNLKGTNIHFSQSILPVKAIGYAASGQYTLSDDKKSITATVRGECASIYFGQEDTFRTGGFTHGPMLTHEVPVWFDNIGKTSFQSMLTKSNYCNL